MNTYLLMITFCVWVIELPVAALNYFLLIKRVPTSGRRLCAASMPQSPSAGQAADSRAPT